MSFLKNAGLVLPNSASCPKLASFLNPASVLPDITGLVGLYVIGGSPALSERNLASGGAAAAPVGSPTFNAFGATFNQANCLDTLLPETTAWTYMAIAQPIVAGLTAGNGAMMVSNFNASGGAIGASLYMNSSTTADTSEQGTSAAAVASLSMGTPTQGDWYQFCARGDGTSEDVTYQHNGAMATQASATVSGRTLASGTLRIGGHYAPTRQANINIGFAAIWNKKLSDANRLASFVALSTFFSANAGLTTL